MPAMQHSMLSSMLCWYRSVCAVMGTGWRLPLVPNSLTARKDAVSDARTAIQPWCEGLPLHGFVLHIVMQTILCEHCFFCRVQLLRTPITQHEMADAPEGCSCQCCC